MKSTELAIKAHGLLKKISAKCRSPWGFGSMTASVYDTAWLAMIQTENSLEPTWMFPRSFEYLLQTQGEDGLWPRYHSDVDVILNSLAALLALVIHEAAGSTAHHHGVDIQARISLARQAIDVQLQHWDVKSCNHVGFELLGPTLLRLLREKGIVFDFPGQDVLERANRRKLAAFQPEALLYSSEQTTLVHSLEAFVGIIDFTQIRHHQVNGSFMGSPSSTAAYLLYMPQDEDTSRTFLNAALESCGSGAVPSAFPSSIFETVWSISTLLSAGFTSLELGIEQLRSVRAWLESLMKEQNSLLGFAPGYLADADDTAKTIYVLHHLGGAPDLQPLLQRFSDSTHFRTYSFETSPSFSANCNVLKALVSSSAPQEFASHIAITLDYLCKKWNAGPVRDKWNLSSEYSAMLLSQALVDLTLQWAAGKLPKTFTDLVEDTIRVIVFQIIMQTLRSQRDDGSWGLSVEVSSYAMLTIAYCRRLHVSEDIDHRMGLALQKGREFLLTHEHRWQTAHYLWVEKVTYGSPILTEAYCLAAMKVSAPESSIEGAARARATFGSILSATAESQKTCELFASTPLLASTSAELISTTVSEASLYYTKLAKARTMIFHRIGMSKDKYLRMIPFTWLICNHLNGRSLSNDILWEMMIVSMLNFQVDEYMENVVSSLSPSCLNVLKEELRLACDWTVRPVDLASSQGCSAPARSTLEEWLPLTSGEIASPNKTLVVQVSKTLKQFISHIRFHPAVLRREDEVRSELGQALSAFLLAHITHNEDSMRFKQQQEQPENVLPETHAGRWLRKYHKPGRSYFDWVSTISADHTSCPYSFLFFSCLISSAGEPFCWAGAQPAYYSKAVARHLATMCRQYNDYGSLHRDQAEFNLNSLNFPEFSAAHHLKEAGVHLAQPDSHGKRHEACEAASEGHVEMKQAQKDLMAVAEFERSCVELAAKRLQDVVDESVMVRLSTFVDVTDLYGQIYVLKDIASRRLKHES